MKRPIRMTWSGDKIFMVAEKADEFRSDANTVLKALHQRMRKEDSEFYPAIEAGQKL